LAKLRGAFGAGVEVRVGTDEAQETSVAPDGVLL
jgi:hypothetical protein